MSVVAIILEGRSNPCPHSLGIGTGLTSVQGPYPDKAVRLILTSVNHVTLAIPSYESFCYSAALMQITGRQRKTMIFLSTSSAPSQHAPRQEVTWGRLSWLF